MAEFFMCWPGGCQKALSLSYDDGTATDLPLLGLMRTYDIKGTFHISSGYHEDNGITPPPQGLNDRRLPLTECVQNYDPALCEVAAHGFTHLDLTGLPATHVVQQLRLDRQVLERTFGRIVTGFSYPMGGVNDSVVNVAHNCGLTYARTTKSTGGFALPENWLLWHPTAKHTDPALPELTQRFLQPARHPRPWLFLLWGHSAEFRRDNNWHVIEDFCKAVSGQKSIWYATCGEIYNYARAYQHLIFNTDKTLAYNPTATDVWLCESSTKKQYKIPAGQRVELG